MKLSPQQLTKFATGTSTSQMVDDAWTYGRIPPAMRPLYEGTEAFQIRMASGAGVRFRFASDTRKIAIHLRYGMMARQIFQGTLLVDDHAHPFGPEQQQDEWQGVIFQQPHATQREFEIWLPNMCETHVVAVEVDDDATLSPASPLQQRWLIYGDSITQGMTSSLPHLNVAGRCTRMLGVDALNLGVGGACADVELAATIPDYEYDVVSIAYGTNDYNGNVPVQTYQANVTRLVAALRAKRPGRPIVVITALTWHEVKAVNDNGESLQDFRDALSCLPRDFEEVVLVQGNDLVPDEVGFFVDNVHPNDEGFERYAAGLLPYLHEALRSDEQPAGASSAAAS